MTERSTKQERKKKQCDTSVIGVRTRWSILTISVASILNTWLGMGYLIPIGSAHGRLILCRRGKRWGLQNSYHPNRGSRGIPSIKRKLTCLSTAGLTSSNNRSSLHILQEPLDLQARVRLRCRIAFLSNSKPTTRSCPFHAARCAAVQPSLSLAETDVPAFSSCSTASSLPCLAAKINGVWLLPSRDSSSAPWRLNAGPVIQEQFDDVDVAVPGRSVQCMRPDPRAGNGGAALQKQTRGVNAACATGQCEYICGLDVREVFGGFGVGGVAKGVWVRATV
ncbi:hypothetical protein F4803DRAFT_256921 [Xylaria telfairii]|nr:hypothetical protein F4803DRAFT_256921 [Xylaria telfairii]